MDAHDVAQAIRSALRCGRPGCACARGARVHCPAHGDQHPSLSLDVKEGRVVFRCHARCPQGRVLEELVRRGLWPSKNPGTPVVRTRYELRDEHGVLVAIHVREDLPGGRKKLWWERPDGRKGLGGMRVTELPLYGVDRLNNAAFVVVTEGEKSAEAQLRLGISAVGTVTGAGGVPSDESLQPLLRLRTVYLWPDADPPGRTHAERIARRLYALGHTDIRWVSWSEAPPGGDAADLVAAGGTRQDVDRLLEQAAVWKPPEAQDGAELLRDLEGYFTRYLVLPPGAPLALAAWVMATWLVDAFEVAPYLAITSAEKRCGKTTLLDLLSYVVREPLATANISEAALFRVVEERRPTLLVDEAQILRDRTERSAALHDLLAAGHVRGHPVYRVAKAGDSFHLERYDPFGLKALALIGELTDVLADRSIRVRMHRRAPHEAVARFRRTRVRGETEDLRRRLEAWAVANEARVREAYALVDPPAWLNDRAADNWSALWAVVKVAAPDRLQDLEAAARALEADGQDLGRESVGIQLLADLRQVFENRQADWLPTGTILEDLRADSEGPWREWKGRGLTAHALARLLGRYGVRPEKRGHEARKGYARAALEDAWARYLPPVDAKAPQPPQSRQDAASSRFSNLRNGGAAEVSKNGPNPHHYCNAEDAEVRSPSKDPTPGRGLTREPPPPGGIERERLSPGDRITRDPPGEMWRLAADGSRLVLGRGGDKSAPTNGEAGSGAGSRIAARKEAGLCPGCGGPPPPPGLARCGRCGWAREEGA